MFQHSMPLATFTGVHGALLTPMRLGVTSVMVTHDVRGAFRVADRLALLADGKIVLQGSPEEFRKSESVVVKAFLERDFESTSYAA